MGYKERFIELLAKSDVLRFGDFTTKSGRKTPYFLNLGNIKTGAELAFLGEFYAECFVENVKDRSCILYGPAYKGIPLVVSASVALFQNHKIDLPILFNRKEKKDHGEGGMFIGETPKPGDNIVIIEDVVTAGTSIKESIDLLKPCGVNITNIIISVDRMEKGQSGLSTLEEMEKEYGFKIFPIVTVKEIISYLHNREVDGKVYIDDGMKAKMEQYLQQYGC